MCSMKMILALLVGLSSAPCADRETIIQQLKQGYSEVVVGLGVSNSRKLVELLMSKDGATWSILVTPPQGPSCVIAVGEGWRTKPVGTRL